jgi:5'-nucleotidase
MRVLVTNDDGVESRGLHVLARALVDTGLDVIVAAPDRDMSGSAAAIGQIHIDQEIEAEPIELPDLAGVVAYAVDGPPGLCVLAARLGGFGQPPDLVVSGINPGCNTGRAILHSGTVGAALTAANLGARGLAVSIDVTSLFTPGRAGRSRLPAGPTLPPGHPIDAGRGQEAVAEVVGDAETVAQVAPGERADDPAHWATAAGAAVAAIDWLLAAPECTVINVNVPNLPVAGLAGARHARLAPFGTVRSSVVESAPGGGRLQMELRPTGREMPADSDTGLVAQGFVAITPIVGPRADDLIDVGGLLEAVAVEARRSA